MRRYMRPMNLEDGSPCEHGEAPNTIKNTSKVRAQRDLGVIRTGGMVGTDTHSKEKHSEDGTNKMKTDI